MPLFFILGNVIEYWAPLYIIEYWIIIILLWHFKVEMEIRLNLKKKMKRFLGLISISRCYQQNDYCYRLRKKAKKNVLISQQFSVFLSQIQITVAELVTTPSIITVSITPSTHAYEFFASQRVVRIHLSYGDNRFFFFHWIDLLMKFIEI